MYESLRGFACKHNDSSLEYSQGKTPNKPNDKNAQVCK